MVYVVSNLEPPAYKNNTSRLEVVGIRPVIYMYFATESTLEKGFEIYLPIVKNNSCKYDYLGYI